MSTNTDTERKFSWGEINKMISEHLGPEVELVWCGVCNKMHIVDFREDYGDCGDFEYEDGRKCE